MDMDILVDERVLIPRPETELLVSTVEDFCRRNAWKEPLILDLGTGSGIISIGLAGKIPGARITASDVSADALCVAGENIKRLGYADRIRLVESDMFKSFGAEYRGRFDIIVSNPPYVSGKDYAGLDAWVLAEPRIALYGGTEGMDHLETIADESGKFLKRGGLLAVEVGYDQSEKVKDKLSSCGFENVRSVKDLNGYERVITGWKHG
jgi:release factor glutamine methyltransferase